FCYLEGDSFYPPESPYSNFASREPLSGTIRRGWTPHEVFILEANALEAAPRPAISEVVKRPNVTSRFGPRWFNWMRALLGSPGQRRLGYAALQVGRIRYWESEFSRLSDEEVRKRGQQFRGRARGGESLDHLLPEMYGLICVAALRTIGLRPFDVQL